MLVTSRKIKLYRNILECKELMPKIYTGANHGMTEKVGIENHHDKIRQKNSLDEDIKQNSCKVVLEDEI